MKQTTRLHDFFHPVIMFHIAGWKKSMRVRETDAFAFSLLLLLFVAGCTGESSSGSGAAAASALTRVTIAIGSGGTARAVTGATPAGVQSGSAEAFNAAGASIAGPVFANLPGLTATLNVPNGAGIIFRVNAYSGANGTGNLMYQGASAPQTLTGAAVSVPISMSLAIGVTASAVSVPRGALVDLNGTVAGVAPTAGSPLLWTANGGALGVAGLNGATNTWTAPATLGAYTITANINPLVDLTHNQTVTGSVVINVINRAPTLTLSSPAATVQAGAVNTAVTATGADADRDAVGFSLSAASPAWATVHPTTGVVTLSPPTGTAPGTYNIGVIPTDAMGLAGAEGILLVTLLNSTAVSTTHVWTGALTTDWNTAGNWDAGTVPGVTSSVLIPAGPANQPITTGMSIASLANQAGSTLALEGNSRIANGFTNNGTIDFNTNTGKTLIVAGLLTNAGAISSNVSGSIINAQVVNTGAIIVNQNMLIDPAHNSLYAAYLTFSSWK
jgi:hypothetical protein